MVIELAVESEADRKLIEHLLVVLRGLRLSRDVELAEAAIKAERGLTETTRQNQRELLALETTNGA